MKATNASRFTITPVTLTEYKKGPDGTKRKFTYPTHRVTGWLGDDRIRRQFRTRAEAEGEVHRLNVQAANVDGQIRTVLTRMTDAQVRDAEAALALVSVPLVSLARFYQENYRPPVTEISVEAARDAFVADRTPHVSKVVLGDYRRTLTAFVAMFSGRPVHLLTTTDVDRFMKARRIGRKRHNNLRGELNAFFVFCLSPGRKWIAENPVAGIAKFKIARGIPDILTVEQAAELMAYVETYRGGPRSTLPPGCLANYFALCLFGGLRPSVHYGEIRKLGDSPHAGSLVDTKLGVIRITPEIAKNGFLRRVTIQPNLAAWLERFPIDRFPIVVPNLQALVSHARRKFNLSHDVLRHTMISNHYAKFKSLGAF
jgi:hypothetical protein